MNICEIKDYEKKYFADYDRNWECIMKTAKIDLVICTPKEIDNKIEELGDKHYDFEGEIEVEIKFKNKETEIIEEYYCGWTTNPGRGFGLVENEIIDEYLDKYTNIESYCEIEELRITYKNMNVEVHTTTCEFCGVTFENDDDYWGCGCNNCGCDVCLDCLTDTDYGVFCPDCLDN